MKKLKLSMTIASLCLAIAVLCFGVFSAVNVTYTIGGTISYEVTDVFADVTTRVYTSAFKDSATLQAEAQKYANGTGTGTVTDYKYDFSTTGKDSESYSNKTEMEGNTTGGIAVNYNSTDKRTYFIVVSVTNKGSNTINVNATTPSLDASANTITAKVGKVAKIEKDGTGKIVFAFMLDDLKISVTSATFDYTVSIANGEYIEKTGTLDYVLPTGVTAQTKVYSQDTMPYTESGVYRASKLKTFAQGLETNNTLTNATKTYDYTSSKSNVAYQLDETKTLNFIVTTITNNSGNSVYVKLTDKKEMSFYSTNTYIYRSQDIESLANGKTATLVVAYKKYKDEKDVSLKDEESGYIYEVGNASSYSALKFAEAQYYPNSTVTRDAYYYVEMGDFYGLPVRWMLIATKTQETSGDGVWKYSDNNYYKNFVATKDNKPQSGTNAIFYQETNTGISMLFDAKTEEMTEYCYSERNETESEYCHTNDSFTCDVPLTAVAFNSYNNSGYKAIKDGVEQETNANNYFNSKIRDYLTGTTDIIKSIMQEANTDGEYLDLESGDKSYYTKDLNIQSTNSIYKKIIARTQMETKTGVYDESGWDTSSGTDYSQGQSVNDNFWLLSMEEMLTWLCGETTAFNVNSDFSQCKKAFSGWGYIDMDALSCFPALNFRSSDKKENTNYVLVDGLYVIGHFGNYVSARGAFNMAI